MAHKQLVVIFSLIAAASPVSATQPEPSAPPAPADARYCLKVEPVTGTRIETIRCETRAGWAWLEVDLDKEWAEEGVKVIGPAPQTT
jgi:hypothetical protein